ncbi:MAG: hypothetical protein OEN56_01705 [Gemmatimonadota bacterium]|nr:hypothetical protein [Gemmatimonadota bacterium]MDH3423514.1 hypothetical protein [Gemmatimonadota bacterium]
MRHRTAGTTTVLGLLFLASAQPATAQLWFFPDYAVPSANGTPSTFIAGTYGRGLNDASGKLDAIGAVIGRTGEQASFMGGLGFISGAGDDEITAGAAVGVDVAQSGSATVAVQGGVGWFSEASATFLRFPLGVSIKGMVVTPEAQIVPWVMPRVNISRVSSSGFSSTETDLGASGGISFSFPNGFGVHTALDVLFSEDTLVLFGVGGHYVIGAQN